MPANDPLGTVVLVHGLGEHAGRYGEVAAHLHQWGFAVRAYDQQGHGQSEGARGDMLRPVDAAVLSSPALGAFPNLFQKMLLATLPRMLPHLRVDNGLKAEFVSRDPDVVKAYTAAPLVHRRISAGLAAWILENGEKTLHDAAQWPVPTLLLYAGQDRLVNAQATADFVDAAPQAMVQASCFEAMYHEIFNDPYRAQVFTALKRWLLARFSV